MILLDDVINFMPRNLCDLLQKVCHCRRIVQNAPHPIIINTAPGNRFTNAGQGQAKIAQEVCSVAHARTR
ncbi:hypothetical protein D1012_12305 [Pseudotabrizicola alkalilacus]|uniref:Uncharacterized protein n=1 Tax=Pseudotabrizicola alkalilacus TaxID=2305252 RepID=A0A411Z1H9_9RHOB|nr:hypothetical protein D1012_12305 [Pseudotabrizicola alkalilacus]